MAGKPLSFMVSGSSSGTFSYTVEGTLQDITQVASGSLAWASLASGSANSSMSVYLGPLAAVRLNVSAASSASVTLRGVEAIGW
jgi:hypothetical protein